MKRFLSILCAVALLCSWTAAYAQAADQPAVSVADAALQNKTVTAVEEKLIREWEKGLAAANEIYTYLFWALDYIDQWTESTNWDTLSQAKTACILLAGYINDYKHPEMTLTSEEAAELAENGYIIEILTDFATPAVTLDEMLLPFRYEIFPRLEEDAFWADSFETVKELASSIRQSLQTECKFIQLATNALWMPLYAQEDAGALWRALQDTYPVLFSKESVWCNDMEALEEANIALYSQADVTDEYSEVLLRAIAREENAIIDLENGHELETISISGAPAGIPVPVWYDSVVAKYASFRVHEDSSLTYPACGDVLTKEDCSMLMQQADVTLEQVEEYVECLDPQRITRKENTWIVLTEEEKGVQISWENNTVQFLFLRESTSFLQP